MLGVPQLSIAKTFKPVVSAPIWQETDWDKLGTFTRVGSILSAMTTVAVQEETLLLISETETRTELDPIFAQVKLRLFKPLKVRVG